MDFTLDGGASIADKARSMGSNGYSPPQALAQAVRDQRKDLGLTQAQLAELAGVGVAFLYDLERGKPTVRLDKVLAVLEVLGLEMRIEARRGGVAGDGGTQ